MPEALEYIEKNYEKITKIGLRHVARKYDVGYKEGHLHIFCRKRIDFYFSIPKEMRGQKVVFQEDIESIYSPCIDCRQKKCPIKDLTWKCEIKE
ncbi:MAG: hypothetical protein GY679_02105 [Mycoplasma sp.]|nr:hypothetical protein [Mycoplasma sp.]